MSSELDKSLEEIQKELWAEYTETVIEHALNPRNVGDLPNADGYGSVTGVCGDNMQIWINVDCGIINEITFWTDGCGTSIAAGSMVTELAKGKDVIKATKIKEQDVLDALGGMPDESTHCALLAADTLNKAIKDYLANKNEPWRKVYRQQ
jgi:nitrogen fixation NifU-like protein